MSLPTAVYVHIPFCEHICHYCDFNKVFLRGQPVDDYLSVLEIEMKSTVTEFPFENIKTIYIGGGTPSVLTPLQLEKLVSSIDAAFLPQKGIEYTFEVNPGNISEDKLSVLKNAGVNRLSIGVQTFNEELLKRIGRDHNKQDIYDTITLARKFRFENISIDLMFGLPNQSVTDFKDTINQALQLEVPHFSAYSLKVEEKTIFHQLLNKGKLTLPTEDEEVKMYDLLMNTLSIHNYNHYEISNFSKKGYESQHNLTYWNNNQYYGVGAGAHGYLGNERYANIGPINKYLTKVENTGRSVSESHAVSEKEKIEEEMFLGLRKLEGVSVQKFSDRYEKSPFDLYGKEIEQLKERKLINVDNDRIFLTRDGLFVANEVFEKFLF